MKLRHYPETDGPYVEFRAAPSVETREVSDGLDVDHASRRLDLSTLETGAPPVRSTKAG